MDKSWLRSAQVAMEYGQLQEAYSFLLEVKHFHSIKFFMGASGAGMGSGLSHRGHGGFEEGAAGHLLRHLPGLEIQ